MAFFFIFSGKCVIISIPGGEGAFAPSRLGHFFFLSFLISVMAISTKTIVLTKSLIMLMISATAAHLLSKYYYSNNYCLCQYF